MRPQPWYRAEAFASGLRAVGFKVEFQPPQKVESGDVMVIWNRYGWNHDLATRFERDGGTVLVAENGYLGEGGTSPKFDVHPGGPKPHHYYALALGWHNGRGTWPAADPERFKRLGVELKPWRGSGEHILVCPNRSFGVGEQVMPDTWAEQTSARLRKETGRPVVIRRHPGNDKPARDLMEDVRNAWAVVIWSSGAGVKALSEGVPVYSAAPYWVMKGASATGNLECPTLPDRLPFFERMASAQWQVREIESGEAFRRVLRAA